MATGTESKRLTDADLARLANNISSHDMEKLALKYLGFDNETMTTALYSHRENSHAFNKDMLGQWMNKNRDNSRQVR